MNHAISINPDKTLVITVPEGTEVDRVKIRKMGTQESKLYWRDEVLDQYKWERDIAIQQLKELGYGFGQEPKTYGDTISRQAAIDVASRECHEWRGIFSDIEQGLKELPSAQPKTKKGKWILKKELVPLPWDCTPLDYDNYDEDTHSEWREFYYCSECDWKSGEFKGGNFCPCCGADMRGEKK